MDEFNPQIGPPPKAMGSAPPPPPPPEAADEPADLAELVPQVDEGMVRSILAGLGNVANVLDRQPAAPDLWRFTDSELDQLAGPITRLANRNEVLRRALLHGDLVVIAMTLGGYGIRHVQARKEATDDTRHPLQADGRPGPTGAGPAGGGPVRGDTHPGGLGPVSAHGPAGAQ